MAIELKDMDKILIILLICCSSFKSNSQTFENLINEQKIDTFAFYSPPGGKSNVLFWAKNSNYYISKSTISNKLETTKLDSLNPLQHYLSNFQLIDNNKTEPFSYLKPSKDKSKNDTILLLLAHKSEYKLTIFQNGKSKQILLNDFDLWKKSTNGETNIYWEYNKNQEVSILFAKISQLL